MTVPPSRMDEASQGAFPVQYAEYCPHCIAARDMFSQCPTCSSRDFPGTAVVRARHGQLRGLR